MRGSRRRFTALWSIPSLLVAACGAARAADGIEVVRGSDSTVFGNCVPSLVADNRSGETVDYLQVDLVLSLGGGTERTVELKSAYREGVLFPIRPGQQAVLKQHLDTDPAIGAACADVRGRRVVRTICEAEGKACSGTVSVRP